MSFSSSVCVTVVERERALEERVEGARADPTLEACCAASTVPGRLSTGPSCSSFIERYLSGWPSIAGPVSLALRRARCSPRSVRRRQSSVTGSSARLATPAARYRSLWPAENEDSIDCRGLARRSQHSVPTRCVSMRAGPRSHQSWSHRALPALTSPLSSHPVVQLVLGFALLRDERAARPERGEGGEGRGGGRNERRLDGRGDLR